MILFFQVFEHSGDRLLGRVWLEQDLELEDTPARKSEWNQEYYVSFGEVIPCASNNSTDVIYCAFGMCPNHCHIFFMADISYEEYLQNRDTTQYNKDNGYKKAYQKELNKLKYIIEHSLMPELTMLEDELKRHGEEDILEKYPQLTYIVNHLDSIKQEVQTWM